MTPILNPREHDHVFLGAAHAQNEKRTWAAIALSAFMMIAEIIGGTIFGSLAVVADGFHMATHVAALLIAAVAYTFARRYAKDPRFAFGTGKFGDLAGFTSAIILAMISILIGVEAVQRLFDPVAIAFGEAIPIAAAGLAVNIATAWLLGGGGHGHSHGHAHGHGHSDAHAHDDHHDHDHGAHDHGHAEVEAAQLHCGRGTVRLEIFEAAAAHFRLRFDPGCFGAGDTIALRTLRRDGKTQIFTFIESAGYFESVEAISEPHEFRVLLEWARGSDVETFEVPFAEPDHVASADRDLNMRAAFVHVVADAAVSVLAIGGLVTAYETGWLWLDPAISIVGAIVIANWAYGLVRDAGGILLDVLPDKALADRLRREIEQDGDHVTDLHLWRLGPGHLGAVISVMTEKARDSDFYRGRLGRFRSLSHVTVEVETR